MAQKQIKNYAPSGVLTPTWPEVYTYWHSKEVPKLEVVSFDPDVHDEGIPWFEKNLSFNDRRNFFYFLRESPKVDTAWAIARTISKGSLDLYAAFAVMTTLRHLDEPSPLVRIVRVHLDQTSSGISSFWHPNSRRVLPCTVDGGVTFWDNPDWRLRVDLAAKVWTEMAERFQVVRQPLWT